MSAAAAQVEQPCGGLFFQHSFRLIEVGTLTVNPAGQIIVRPRAVLFGDKRGLGCAHGEGLHRDSLEILHRVRCWCKLRHYPGMKPATLDIADDARHLLGRFVRARREAMPVSATTLSPTSPRRRTPGLRREEVAELSAISTTWYTWLEQGREISLSVSALARLVDVLHLSAAERAYLFELARRRDRLPPCIADDAAVTPTLLAAVHGMPMPAYLLDRTWRLCAWNSAAADLLAPWLLSGERCLLRYVFVDPSARDFIRDWDERAGRLVAEFRADSALYPDATALALLIAQLQRGSPAFTDCWNRHDVLAREGGRRWFNHRGRGPVAYEQMTLVPSCSADHKLVLLLLIDDDLGGRPGQSLAHAQ